jgi:glyoxalase family protein
MAAPIVTQGVHHITLVGADRQTSIDFWQGILGMPFVFEQPNLDDAEQNHLYFDPGDGRLITIFTREDWPRDATPNPTRPGNVHHIAFNVSRAMYTQAAERLRAAGFANSGEVDRGFMYSLYFRDPLGHLFELACYKFEPPEGYSHADVLAEAHRIRVAREAHNIEDRDLADALIAITAKAGRAKA